MYKCHQSSVTLLGFVPNSIIHSNELKFSQSRYSDLGTMATFERGQLSTFSTTSRRYQSKDEISTFDREEQIGSTLRLSGRMTAVPTISNSARFRQVALIKMVIHAFQAYPRKLSE
ncbi:hypothetical protein E1B28_007850 [Marasmius oreades]|uniref:Uncharacterized protein n=1 Tax=Marasmius oreades TaxID=181124 RepID=A0A9P7S2T2_9AGAR|nr:uncharacterized protein E1B28_007850 [Marasmius oreades]KAG7094245.1 hypothetical protein E1B28_007850 [Marasmius oreades]